MDDSSNASTFQSLAGALAGGLAGYLDAQNSQPITVTAPAPQTAYGYAGVNQGTPTSASAMPSWLIPVALIGVVLLLVLRK